MPLSFFQTGDPKPVPLPKPPCSGTSRPGPEIPADTNACLFPRTLLTGMNKGPTYLISLIVCVRSMRTYGALILCILCIAATMLAGCIQPDNNSPPLVTRSGTAPAVTGTSVSGNAPFLSCTVGPSADPSKSGILQILSAQGEVITNNVIMISGKIRNNAGEGTSSGVAAKLCNSRTGNCVKDMVGEIFKPYETVDYSLIPLGGCPDTGSDASSCTCEVWIDILR
jgi:hypothetical protein